MRDHRAGLAGVHQARLAEKSLLLPDPLQGVAGEGRQEPLAYYLQIGRHDLVGEQRELGETRLMQDLSLADVTPFSRFSFSSDLLPTKATLAYLCLLIFTFLHPLFLL